MDIYKPSEVNKANFLKYQYIEMYIGNFILQHSELKLLTQMFLLENFQIINFDGNKTKHFDKAGITTVSYMQSIR